MVGEYLKAIGSEVAKEFQELTKAAAPLPDSPGLGEMVQQLDTKIPKLEMPKEEVYKAIKLEIPEPEEEEADNPSLDKRSKKKTPIKRKLEIKEEVADDDNPSPEKFKKEKSCRAFDGDEEKTKPAAKAPASIKKEVVVGSQMYVSNISRETSVDELKEAFEKYGTITDATKARKGRNGGRITFSSPEEALDAVDAMNGTELGGRTIFCCIVPPQGYVDPAVKEGRKVFIRNVSGDSSYEDFEDAVEKFGEVTNFYNTCGKLAFLTFSTSEQALACVAALDKTEFAGRTIEMKISKI